MINLEEEKRGSFHGMRKPSVSMLAKPLIKRDPLFSASVWEIMKVMEIFRETCVERVCSRHCTEDSAPSPFRESYGGGSSVELAGLSKVIPWVQQEGWRAFA